MSLEKTPRFTSRTIVAVLLSMSLSNCSGGSSGGTAGVGGQGSSGATSSGGATTAGGGSGISGTGGASNGAAGSAGGSAMGGSAQGGSAMGGSATGGGPAGGSAQGGSATSGGAAGGSAQGGGSASCPTISDFTTWPSGSAPLDVGKLAVNDFLGQTQKGYGSDGKAGDGYAWAFTYFGALQFTKTINDSTTNSKLVSDYAKFLASGLPLPPNGAPGGTGVDQRAFGDLPFEIFLENQDQDAKALGLTRADMQWSATNADGSTQDARWWADDMFMITGLQVFAYRATKDAKYLDRAAKMMVTTFGKLQKVDGLFWHTEKTPVYWGRANGWVAAGMTELLLEMAPGADRDAIMAGYKKQMDGLLKAQFTSGTDPGAWNQVLDITTAKPEMSCTAMFTYALATGVKNGWLTDPKYATAARNGWLALAKRTSSSGQLDQVCPGTGDAFGDAGVTDLAAQQKFYMDKTFTAGDRHGQAPLIWAARALLRADCPGLR